MTGQPSSAEPDHWLALDGVRGLLCLVVMAFHLWPRLALGGQLSLEAFCVLSGLVIATALWRDVDRTGRMRLRTYAWRRAMRLYPAMIAMLLAFVLTAPLVANPLWGAVGGDALLTLVFGANVTRAAGIPRPLLFGHTWSIALEAQFYLLLPVVVALVGLWTRRPRHVALILFGLAVVSFAVRHGLAISGATLSRVYNGPDARLAAPLLGAALGIARFDPSLRARLDGWMRRPRVLDACVATLGVSLFVPWRVWPQALVAALTGAALLSVPLLVAAMGSVDSTGRRLLEHPATVMVGRWSYSLFLWHYPVFGVLFFAGLGTLAVALIGIPASFVIGGLSYHGIELPARRWVVAHTRAGLPSQAALAPQVDQ